MNYVQVFDMCSSQTRLGCVLGIPQPAAALLVAAGGRAPFVGSRQQVR